MKSKKIDELVGASYKHLDKQKVNAIASLITTSDLKKYIKKLKSAEKENTLTISSPNSIVKQDLKKIIKLFPHKKIILERDPSLMLGMRITDNDIVYDFTLKNSLDKILSYLEQNYV